MGESRITQNYDEQVRSIIASVRRVPIETVSLNSSLEDLGIDSVEGLTLIFELEDAFKIDIPDEGFERSRTVRELIDQLTVLLPASET